MSAALLKLILSPIGRASVIVVTVLTLTVGTYIWVQHRDNAIRAEARAAALLEFNAAQLVQSQRDQERFEADRARHELAIEAISQKLAEQNAHTDERAAEAERAIDNAELEDRPLSPLLRRMLSELEHMR
jgi:uncharacterized protein HemX